MKWLLCAVFIYPLLCFGSFENETFKIEIDQGDCSEYDIACNGIIYHSINKKNGTTLTIKNGRTLNVGAMQNFRGYVFEKKGYIYNLIQGQYPDDGDDAWQLLVTAKAKSGYKILLEQKIWAK
ncbi:hypothetical protein [Atlantibacter sp. RC6]|uniref:hypothetical protein n=1 Tax=Atlantibacter sp. RC6 TaxID=2587036 RepID=UPI00160592D7|nr:hypothetical protein [Atlantibacter sp. RC6]MBB3322500.1 hypothetical protein [Atlantibacter sp. RC6]